jgi:hypothetical protein
MTGADELRRHIDAFEYFINGPGSSRPDAERGALISLGYIVTFLMEDYVSLLERVNALEGADDGRL